ncbi:hypothetical protein TEA_029497 [Camellia sinensis var. sinensis]|uniref:Uncharacterized protein n=1 Tax=Camellia sinensis var. sinensis TaxID=542762 RepID=A0A4S4DUP6_CAMSN|nr:hypothetical protein TEA_029497 [Camellia sinensis var. sinensis]
MPTELMAWQYGAISPTPMPLEPRMPSDRYAIDPDSPLWEAAWMYLLGARPPVDRVSGRVSILGSSPIFGGRDGAETPGDRAVCSWLPDVPLGTTLFADRGNTIGLYCERSSRPITVWAYDILPSLAPVLEVVGIPVTPYSLIFEGPHRARPRETLVRLRQLLGSLGHLWVMISYFSIPEHQASPGIGSCSKGQSAESGSWGALSVPGSRRHAGQDALLYVAEGDYATYRHIYLMPPLTEARIPMMRPAGSHPRIRLRLGVQTSLLLEGWHLEVGVDRPPARRFILMWMARYAH